MLKGIGYKSVLICCLGLLAFSVKGQEAEPTTKSNADIAKELSNPNTSLGMMAFQIDYIHYTGNLPNAGMQNGVLLNFQPSLPIPLSNGVNLFVRPLIPFFISQPTYGVNGFEQKGFNLGNISADVAVGKTWPSKTITIVGAFGSFPTASNKSLRSDFTMLGPEFMVAQIFSWGVIGAMVNHAWSVNSNDADAGSFTTLSDAFWTTTAGQQKASITAGQYFYVVNLKNAWQITGQPTWAYNHEAAEGNKFTFPIGTGVNKVVSFGKLPVKISLQYWYYIAKPDSFGPQHQIRFQIAPVIPLPW